MPDICAAIGLAQLRQYGDKTLPVRKNIVLKYLNAFKTQDWFIEPPLAEGGRESSYHYFPLRIKGITEQQRDAIIDEITGRDIAVNVHFIPLPMLTYFKGLGYNIAHFPAAYQQYATEISLPVYPQLTDHETDLIIACVMKAVTDELEARRKDQASLRVLTAIS